MTPNDWLVITQDDGSFQAFPKESISSVVSIPEGIRVVFKEGAVRCKAKGADDILFLTWTLCSTESEKRQLLQQLFGVVLAPGQMALPQPPVPLTNP